MHLCNYGYRFSNPKTREICLNSWINGLNLCCYGSTEMHKWQIYPQINWFYTQCVHFSDENCFTSDWTHRTPTRNIWKYSFFNDKASLQYVHKCSTANIHLIRGSSLCIFWITKIIHANKTKPVKNDKNVRIKFLRLFVNMNLWK